MQQETSSSNKHSRKFQKALLALEDGTIFEGYGIGSTGTCVAEIVFNTSMTGYQEILTDPSYFKQAVVLTYPHIGNTGINHEDLESNSISCSGLIIRDYSLRASNWRSHVELGQWLKNHGTLGIAGIDTRHLTHILREKGALSGCIMSGTINAEEAINQAKKFKGLLNADLAIEVTTKKSYPWREGSWQLEKGYQKYQENHFKNLIVVYDFGVKKNMLRLLVDQGYELHVVPATTKAEEVLKLKPNGILLSNGPGDPAACHYAIDNIKKLLKKNIPILGICLGHQLLALACGAKTKKMKFGHHGANHPVKNSDNQVMITSQNHGFAINETTVTDSLKVSHVSLFDQSIQGIKHKTLPALGFQGHPEASPGPHDMGNLFATFKQLIDQHNA